MPEQRDQTARCFIVSGGLELNDDEALFGHLANRPRRAFARVAGGGLHGSDHPLGALDEPEQFAGGTVNPCTFAVS